jgi:biotin/methionine sulfoxide reductase
MPLLQTASHWGVYAVELDGDAVAHVQPFALDANPSPLIHGLPAIVRGGARVARPAVRAGYLREGPGHTNFRRGLDPFVEISWDRALRLVAEELRRVRARHGDASVYGGSYGWASAGRLHHSPGLLKRFLGLGGGYTDRLGNHSFGAALVTMPHVIGRHDITRMTSDWPVVVSHTRLMVMFGGAHPKNMQIDSGGVTRHSARGWMQRAREAGVQFVLISPSRGDLATELNAEWLSIRPNTDVAFMLGLAQTLAGERLADHAFLERYCTGYERFAAYLNGVADGVVKDSSWAARICDVPADAIRTLARRIARTRTMLSMSWSVQRADHGEQPCWALVALAAMLGQIGLPGGGFGLGYGAVNGVGAPLAPGIPKPKLPLEPNPVKARVPVGRVTDMLLRPGATIDYNGGSLVYPDIRLVYCCGGNPFHHSADLNKTIRSWQKPETIIVHEPFWTAAAKHADIVLPATTALERNDILAAELDDCYVAMKQVMLPVGGARNDLDIFGELAERLGYGIPYTQGRAEMEWLRHMYHGAALEGASMGIALPDFDEFWAQGSYAFPPAVAVHVLLSDFRADPLGHALMTPSGKIELWSETVASFGYADCPGHPVWLEPAEWLGGEPVARYPLHLLSNQPGTRLHSQLDPAPLSLSTKVQGREPLSLHPDDAAARGIAAGDLVEVVNDRGRFVAGARLDHGLRRGVVQIATGAWYDPVEPGVSGTADKHGNPNLVTLDKGTSSLAQSTSAQTALVEVRRLASAPPVTAFAPPQFDSAA